MVLSVWLHGLGLSKQSPRRARVGGHRRRRRAAHHAIGRYTLGATLVNALDTRWREAQFAESSRPTPMGAEAEDVHFTPGAPRTALVTVGYRL